MGIAASREKKNKLRLLKESIKANKLEIENLKEIFDFHAEKANGFDTDFKNRFQRMHTELNSKLSRNGDLETRLNDLEASLPNVDQLTAFNIELNKLKVERSNYELNLPNKIKELLDKEKANWAQDIEYIKEKYESQRQLSRQLTTTNLSQEKQIKELKEKIQSRLNKEEISKTCKCNHTLVSRSSIFGKKNAFDDSSSDSVQRSELEVKIDRLSQHILRVKSDLGAIDMLQSSSLTRL